MRKAPAKGSVERSERHAAISKRILDALERVKSNKPTVAKLLERARKDKLKVNPSTVSLEAGVSRTNIGKIDCNFPDERKKVLAESNRSKRADRLAKKSKEQAETLVQALAMVRERDTIIASLLNKIEGLEKSSSRQKSRDRWRKKDKRKKN